MPELCTSYMSVNEASKITIDNSRVMLKIVASLTDNSRGIIYKLNMIEYMPLDSAYYYDQRQRYPINTAAPWLFHKIS
jgi:hypothetical protein